MWFLDSAVLELLARQALGAIFLLAGIVKISRPSLFERDIGAYHLLPPLGARVLGFALPPFEVALGFMLVVGILTEAVALVTVGLCSIFVLATASAHVRRLNVECGCFGLLYREKLGRSVIIRDAFLVMLAAWVVQYQGTRFAGTELLEKPSDWVSILALAGMVTIAVICAKVITMLRPRSQPAVH